MSTLKRKASQGSGGASVGKKQRSSSRRTRRMPNSVLTKEVKYVDTLSNPSLTTTAAIVSLCDVALGDAYNQRNGNQVLNKYVQYNFFAWSLFAATIVSQQPYRFDVYIVLDRQCNGAAPIYSNIFDTSTIVTPYAMKNIAQYQERFKILKHHQGVTASTCSENSSIAGFIDLQNEDMKDRVVRFAPGGATIVPSTNGIFAVLISNATAANLVSFTGGFRLAFNDV